MSASKTFMARKLACVQESLMGMEFEDTNLHTILPIIFNECQKQNMTFWFNFIENACVLNLRDTSHENYELNIRQYIGNDENTDLVSIKRQVLCNAFLLTVKSYTIETSRKSEDSVKEGHIAKALKESSNDVKKEEGKIQESNIVPPSSIRIAIDECEKQGEPVTRKNVESKLNLKGMNQIKRRQCIAYLRDMKE